MRIADLSSDDDGCEWKAQIGSLDRDSVARGSFSCYAICAMHSRELIWRHD